MRRRLLLLVPVCLVVACALPAVAMADGPIDANSGMARMVDGPALRSAFAKARTGEVEVGFDLAEDGTIIHAHVVRSTPPGVFDAAALSMVQDTKLPPPNQSTAETPHDHFLIVHFKEDSVPQTSIDARN